MTNLSKPVPGPNTESSSFSSIYVKVDSATSYANAATTKITSPKARVDDTEKKSRSNVLWHSWCYFRKFTSFREAK